MENILGDVDISDASIWADWYKTTPEGRETGSWHFVNAHDSPPKSCDLDFERDCGDRCLVTAILNVTRQLGDRSTSALDKTQALKFLLHLFGDLHQPLHLENLARGGNDIPVLFEEEETNLHYVWDVIIPQKITSSNETNEVAAAKAWAEKLHSLTAMQVFSEDYWATSDHLFEQEKAKPKKELMRRIEASIRVIAWARETNQWVCDYVLKDGLEGVEEQELSGEYYVHAVTIVEGLIARAGRRLGKLINALAEEHGSW